MRERFHAFNTARLVRNSLRKVELIADHNSRLSKRKLPLTSRAGLLYPGPSSRLLSELSPQERPDQLVIIDGTWHHAKTMVRDIPILRSLPRYALAPDEPGNYRIRREPNAFSLSTLEATVSALRMLDPQIERLDELLAVFDRMVNEQLAHPNHKQQWRTKAARTTTGLPRILSGDLQDIVVAYGEADPAKDRVDRHQRWPIAWAAARLDNGETFWSLIRPRRELPAEVLGHLELDRAEFESAASKEDFRDRWKSFLRPNDTLLVYNQSTTRLLKNIGCELGRTIAVKSIDLGFDRAGKTLDELMMDHGIIAREATMPGRCGKRLANLMRWIEHLRQFGEASPSEKNHGRSN